MSKVEGENVASLRYTQGKSARIMAGVDKLVSVLKLIGSYEMCGIYGAGQPVVLKGEGNYRFDLHARNGGETVLYHAPDGGYYNLDEAYIVHQRDTNRRLIERKRLKDSPQGFVEIERPWTGRGLTEETIVEWQKIEEQKKQSSPKR